MQVDLSPDLVAFIAENSGPGTPFTSASEFIAAVLQEKREMLDPLRQAECVMAFERRTPADWLMNWRRERIVNGQN